MKFVSACVPVIWYEGIGNSTKIYALARGTVAFLNALMKGCLVLAKACFTVKTT